MLWSLYNPNTTEYSNGDNQGLWSILYKNTITITLDIHGEYQERNAYTTFMLGKHIQCCACGQLGTSHVCRALFMCINPWCICRKPPLPPPPTPPFGGFQSFPLPLGIYPPPPSPHPPQLTPPPPPLEPFNTNRKAMINKFGGSIWSSLLSYFLPPFSEKTN
jgi:hypothetical protein